jgi:hypothetical protein
MFQFTVFRFFNSILISKYSFTIVWNFKDMPILAYPSLSSLSYENPHAQNIKLGEIWPRHFNGLKKTWLEKKFEASNSRNKFFGIMVPGFYVKYAVFEFKMSS